MNKNKKFELSIPFFFQYLAWRDSQLTARVALEIYSLIAKMDHSHITSTIIEAPEYVSFISKLRARYQYSWLTAREATIIFNIVCIQNRIGSITHSLDKDYENQDLAARFPEVFHYAVNRTAVEQARKNRLHAQSAEKAAIEQRHRNKRLRLQGKQLSLVLPGSGTNNPA